ncbi:uncharacterized protein LOC115079349 isoform X2 [Rhinatrema bivittatum]|uniref:uncharacterized protein LOC115079349 isoform X2 n=1 Tax=Rhinatrema bivittatum TaxID=194408 RepID=UPI001126FE09|nr:uncharacterized protein LOC115079349 isoform X2 [Rhinatrema bivittatum]XP_029438706.1 uncharacterized protein LOC115079349 isoform X2 [Rhinatrema bivittatum]
MGKPQSWKYYCSWGALLCLTCTSLPGQEAQEKLPFVILKTKICKHKENSSILHVKALFDPVKCKHAREGNASSTFQMFRGRPSNASSAYLPIQDFSNASSAYLPSQGSTSRAFGNFSFGIGFSKDDGRMSRAEPLESIDAQLSEQLFVNVMVEGSLGDTELIVRSCQLLDRQNTSIGAYIIQEGCLSNKTAEEVMMGNSKEKIYSLRLSSVFTASELFVACEVQLCKNLSGSQHCLMECGSSFRISHSRNAVLETNIYRISAGPIRITKDTSNRKNFPCGNPKRITRGSKGRGMFVNLNIQERTSVKYI